mgnify:CR=1 FL=1
MDKAKINPQMVAIAFLYGLKPYIREKWPGLAKELKCRISKAKAKSLTSNTVKDIVFAAVVARHFEELDQYMDHKTAEAVRKAIMDQMQLSSPIQVNLVNEFSHALFKAKKDGNLGVVGIGERLHDKLIGGKCNEFRTSAMLAALDKFGMWFWDKFLEDKEIIL